MRAVKRYLVVAAAALGALAGWSAEQAPNLTGLGEHVVRWILGRGIFRQQGHNPTGLAGHVVGWIMGRRSSNVRRNRWAVELLEILPTDRVIALGCGPGVAVAALADRATRGLVVGVDQAEVVIGQARRRNADAISQGRVRLIHAPVERLRVTDGPFDAALAVNTVGMWPELSTRLREIGRQLRRGGRIALVSQPLPGRHCSDLGGGRPACRAAIRRWLRGRPG